MSFTKIGVRNIRKRKLRSFLTIIGIVVAVGLLVGVDIAAETTFVELQNYVLEISGRTDITISEFSGTPFEEGRKTLALQGVTGVNVTGVLVVQGFVEGNDTRKAVSVLGIDQKTHFDYSTYRFEGSSSLAGDDVTISEAIHERLGINVGEVLRVVTDSGGHRFRVVGIFHPKVESQAYQIYTDLKSLQQIYALSGKVSYLAVSVGEMGDTRAIRLKIEENLGSDFRISAFKEETISTWESNLSGWRQGLNSVSIISLFICFGLVLNTVYMNVGERTYEIGVLRALGASRGKIFWVFFSESLVMAGLGLLAGLPAGYGIASLFYELTRGLFYTSTEKVALVLKPEFFTGSAAAGLIATIAGSSIPSFSATRTSVLQALKPRMTPPGKHGTSVKLLLVGSLMLGMGIYVTEIGVETYFGNLALTSIGLVMIVAAVLRMGSPFFELLLSPLGAVGRILPRNTSRNLRRSAITYATIGICISFIIMMGGMQTSITDSVTTTAREYFGAHIIVIPSSPVPATFCRDLEMLNPKDIDSVTYLRFTQTKSGTHTVGIVMIDPSTFPAIFKNLEFTEETPSNIYSMLNTNRAVILVEPLAQTLGVSVGDFIQVYGASGKSSLRVLGIVKGMGLSFFSLGGGFLMSEAAIMSQKMARALFFPSEGKDVANIFMINLADESKIGEVESLIVESFGKHYDLQTVNLNQIMDEVQSTIQKSFSIFDTILYMAVLAASAGIAATMVMNINERQREIGILRAEGMRRSRILLLVIGEAILLGFFGFLVGFPTGVVIFNSAVRAMAAFGLPVYYLIPVERAWMALGLALLSSAISAAYPSLKAVKIRPIEALRQKG